MRIAVIQFPGSNADWDALHAARDVLGADAHYVFHKESRLTNVDAVIIPGVRTATTCGPVPSPGTVPSRERSPSSRTVAVQSSIATAFRSSPSLPCCRACSRGTHTCGSSAGTSGCGARREARSPTVSRWVTCSGCRSRTPMVVTNAMATHCAGSKSRSWWRFAIARHRAVEADFPTNPNGAVANIAGIYNAQRNVLGLMPHPSARARSPGNDDGLVVRPLRKHLRGGAA